MGQILKNWRVLSAAVFALVLISGSYFVAIGFEYPTQVQASEQAALLKAIAAQDTDGDGLPDWQEALYGTDTQKIDSRSLGMSDGEAVSKGLIVPKAISEESVSTTGEVTQTNIDYAALGLPTPTANTLTDAFSKTFFTLYLSTKAQNGGAELTTDQINSIADEAVAQLTQSIATAPDFKNKDDVRIAGSGVEAMKIYAKDAEAIMLQNKSDSVKGDLEYLTLVVNSKDKDAAQKLANLAKSYRDIAIGIAALPVPQELVSVHLSIVNSLMKVSAIYADFARENTDPLTALFALQQYEKDEKALERAFLELARVYVNHNAVPERGMPGALFVSLIAVMSARP